MSTGAPILKFSLINANEGTLVIDDPIGWDDIVGELQRGKGHGVVEVIDVPMTFYGSAVDYINDVKDFQGPNAIVECLIEIDPNGDDQWETFYSARLSFEEIEKINEGGEDFKIKMNLLRNDFWTLFQNRMDMEVDIQSDEDMDGGLAIPCEPIDIEMTGQPIDKESTFSGHSGDIDTIAQVACATTANIALSGLLTIDGIQTVDGTRVLVKNQSDQKENGVYTASPSAWTRASDANTSGELDEAITSVGSGTTNAGTVWRQTTATPTIGVSNIVWASYNYVDLYLAFEDLSSMDGTNLYLDFFLPITLDREKSEIEDTFELPSIVLRRTGTLGTDYDQIGDTIEIITQESGKIKLNYNADLRWRFAPTASGGVGITSWDWRLNIQAQINDGPLFNINADQFQNIPGASTNYYTDWNINIVDLIIPDDVNAEHTFLPGDRLRIFFRLGIKANGTPTGFWIEERLYGGITNQEVSFKMASVVEASTFPGFFQHDVGYAICDRIFGEGDLFHSQTLGSPKTRMRQYDDVGCHWSYGLFKFLHARGYTLEEKAFFASWNQWYKGVDPIFCLGYGYEIDDDGNSYFVVENRGYFYDSSSNSINLDYVNNISETYFTEAFYKAIRIGYQKWESEDIGGIDDPQTRRQYSLLFQTFGQEIEIYSSFIAASLGIEIARRTSKENSADYQYDNDIGILSIVENGNGTWSPEVGSPFSSISGLNNGDQRANLRITAARNMVRFLDFVSGCMSWYPTESLKFRSGDGNYKVESTLADEDCPGDFDGDPLAENQDIPVSTTPMYIPVVKTFKHPLTYSQYKTIRENKNMSIGVSTTNENHVPHFILNLKHKTTGGTADFVLLQAE